MTYLHELAVQIRAEVADDLVPLASDSLFLVYAVLLRAKAEQVTAEDVHDAWVAWMIGRGEQHDSMVPFPDLPPEVKSEDLPFVEAIKAVARQLRYPR